MEAMKRPPLSIALALCILFCGRVSAQQDATITALQGLAAVTRLPDSDAGKAALKANFDVTGGIESGALTQPTLLPFAEQREQALQDAFITSSNLAQLADGLGTTLGAAYTARFHYIDQTQTSAMPRSISQLISYATAVTFAHSNAGKYLFANKTTDGLKAVPANEAALFPDDHEDVFGKAYNLRAGTKGADKYGNSRPFQTEPDFKQFTGPDYFNLPSGNLAYNQGPAMNLIDSPSYPSGHTTYGYTGAVLLAVLVPERYSQMIARGAEYGNDRILLGSHYAMDVLGGRALALYDMAHLLANDPVDGQSLQLKVSPIVDFRRAVRNARAELIAVLQSGCGDAIDQCAQEDTGRFNNRDANQTFYDATQTYNLPVVYEKNAGKKQDVEKLAPKAGYLLTVAFPWLSREEANKILTETEGPGGGFLDDDTEIGVFSRLNLYAAALRVQEASHKQY
jgi:hypothetical protein